MGHRYTKAEILEGALAASLEDGLSQLTFGRVAKSIGMSDRMIVYYFATKDDLVGEVVLSMGLQLQQTIEAAFTGAVDDWLELARAAWPLLARAEADRIFALFFEANGLAAAGRAPFADLVPRLVEGWIEWLSGFFTGPARRRRVEAEALLAVIDGLLLLRQLSGPAAADRAARRLGIR